MLAITCSQCQHKLRVKEAMAGKKGKCPQCGHVIIIPAAAGEKAVTQAGSSAERKRPRVPVGQDDATLPPEEAKGGALDDRTNRGGEHTEPSAVASELTDFLAPAQGPGEIGRLGGYRVLKVLGAGGMGVVYQAEDVQLQRQVALKAMLPALASSPSAKQRFLREARAAAAIEHDHIIAIHQVGEDRGVPFLAMPLLRGEALDDRLRRKGDPLPLAEVLRIGREIAEGLAAAHERELIHRDIKPANIWLKARSHKRPACELGTKPTSEPLVATESRVKILDFGLARAADDSSQLTTPGAIVGTPAFMAPEQASGQKVDGRCDLFSLGCVLYRMATGHPAFTGTDAISTIVAVATEEPTPPHKRNPEIPREVSDLVMRLLAKSPGGRPQTARAVVEAIEKIEAKGVPPAMPSHTKVRDPESELPTQALLGQRAASGLRWTLMAAGGLVVALGIAAVCFFSGAKDRPGPTPPVTKAAEFFNGKDLTGWEGRLDLWRVQNGALIGRMIPESNKLNSYLVSKKTYRDFELRCKVRLTGEGWEGNSGIQFRSFVFNPRTFRVAGPQADMGGKYWGALYGEAFSGLMVPSPQQQVQKVVKPNDFNDYYLRCVGKHVTIRVNGLTTVDETVPRVPDEGVIAWQLHAGGPMEVTFKDIEFTDLSAANAANNNPTKWVPLFNGENLTGWKVYPKGTGKWKVQDGMLVSSGPVSYLFSQRGDYKDFHFRVECSINDMGNSGQFFRAEFGPGLPRGWEAQINATHTDRVKTGSLHPGGFGKGERKPPGIVVKPAPHKPNEWFTQEVICIGPKITILVNGKTTVEWTDPKHRFKSGHFALQQLNDDTVVKFRKIEVLELSDR